MTKAGLDPSRIQERAQMLAKIQGAKRKRDAGDDEDVEMDDDDDDDDSGSANGMDLDDDESAPGPTKRVKTNSGGVINKRAPRSNRQTAGMRDEGQFIRTTKLRNLGQRPRNRLAKAGEGDRAITTKMPKHLFAGKRKGGKTQRR